MTNEELERLRVENKTLRIINAEMLAALKLYVAHYGDPLKVARTAIAKAEGRTCHRLVSAAPDMLQALMDLDPGEAVHITHSESVGCAICAARRAIAKAKGMS